MIEDPHKVLGVDPNASQDDIKKAYRQMAKKYHPDLHPNDPAAAKRMNDINEAYDMLMNPEKYAARRTQQQQSQNRQSRYYGQTQGQGSQQRGTGYQGPGGWASDFGGFDFGDIFGFGFGDTQQSSTSLRTEPGDSADIQRVVSAINNRRYQEAITVLTHIPSTGRNARWYYLSALANNGLGNSVQAMDHMQKAAQMEPNNRTYVQLLQQFRRAGQTYEQHAQGFNMQAANMGKICLGCFAVQCLCGPCSYMRCY